MNKKAAQISKKAAQITGGFRVSNSQKYRGANER
jgi:hypothetical protein